MKLTAIIYPDTTPDGLNPGFSSHCPEFDIASQGDTRDEALVNLREAVELFLECDETAALTPQKMRETP
jgi:predicted RNase H-like HicB family nuclease